MVGLYATSAALLVAAILSSTQIGTTQSSAVRRQPVLFFCVINQGIFAALVSSSKQCMFSTGAAHLKCFVLMVLANAAFSHLLPIGQMRILF